MASEMVAVVVPTHQRRQSLRRVLEALARQSTPDGLFSVVVVCDGCTDGSAQMIRDSSFPFPLEVLEQWPAQGPAAARNAALARVTAPVVLFLDDDVIPDRNLVRIHASHHAAESDLVVIGPLVAPSRPQQPWIRWESDTLRKQYDAMRAGAWSPTPRQFYTGNASVRREHVQGVGGFDVRFRRGEDVDLAFRLQKRSLRFVFDPAAAGTHIARRSFASWIGAATEYGRVEFAMGPVWGERGLVDVKVMEFRRRNPLVRGLVGFMLAHPRSGWIVATTIRAAGRTLAALDQWSLARGAYTTLFEAAYWRGVRDAGGISSDAAPASGENQSKRESQPAAGAHR
jgi:GT2 family glycosyltransferase